MSAMQMVVVNQPLPNGWFQATTEDGKPYYVNAFTQQTQWEFPQTPSTIHVLQSVHVSSSKKNGGVQCFKQVLCNKEHLIRSLIIKEKGVLIPVSGFKEPVTKKRRLNNQ